MRKVFQAAGERDCFRCAVASVLGESKKNVPDFLARWGGDDWQPALSGWLAARGLAYRVINGNGPPASDSAIGNNWIGVTQREKSRHAVVCSTDKNHKSIITHCPNGDPFDPNERIIESIHIYDPRVSPWLDAYGKHYRPGRTCHCENWGCGCDRWID